MVTVGGYIDRSDFGRGGVADLPAESAHDGWAADYANFHQTSTSRSISPVDYHAVHAAAAGRGRRGGRSTRFVTILLAGTLNRMSGKIRGRVDSVDLERHRLQFTDLEQRSCELSWDRLVLTPGSVTRLFDIPGLAQYARGLKSPAEALYLRDHVLRTIGVVLPGDRRRACTGAAHDRSGGRPTPVRNWSCSFARWPTPPQSI